ncbi:unnamed protein product [Camellia sinensis]
MSLTFFLLWLFTVPFTSHAFSAPPRGFLLSCGSSTKLTLGRLDYIPDEGFISVGNKSALKQSNLLPILSTLRYFPDASARKFCYKLPAIKGEKFLVKTIYYYGGFDGGDSPPVFDQIIDGTKWSTVNTTEDFRNGLSSFYEIVVTAHAKTLSVCLARNEKTKSSPFVSAIELHHLEGSLYNSTDFGKNALITVARNSFGYHGDTISYDQFNRFWQPFNDDNPAVESHSNITTSGFWNMPPAKAFASAITTSRGKKLTVRWPPYSLPKGNYYIALYFQDNRTPSPYSWRVFSVSVNGKDFYANVNVTSNGVTIYGTEWPLSGQTEIVMTPASDARVGPVINAGEIFQILPLGKRTLTRDGAQVCLIYFSVMAIEDLARGFNNPPPDWHGDPCLPVNNAWNGVACSDKGDFARVISINLTSVGLTGDLSESIDRLTALKNLWLGGNKLSGSIPEMGSLKALETLHLEGNQFQGPIPKSLGQLPVLREVFLQNNKLDGSIPGSLTKKNGINIHVPRKSSFTGSIMLKGGATDFSKLVLRFRCELLKNSLEHAGSTKLNQDSALLSMPWGISLSLAG